MSISLPPELVHLTSFLRENGFTVGGEERSQHFSNRIIELSGPSLAIRLACDRDVWLIELRNGRTDWLDLQWWQLRLEGNAASAMTIEEEAQYVERHLRELEQLAPLRVTEQERSIVALRNAMELGVPVPDGRDHGALHARIGRWLRRVVG